MQLLELMSVEDAGYKAGDIAPMFSPLTLYYRGHLPVSHGTSSVTTPILLSDVNDYISPKELTGFFYGNSFLFRKDIKWWKRNKVDLLSTLALKEDTSMSELCNILKHLPGDTLLSFITHESFSIQDLFSTSKPVKKSKTISWTLSKKGVEYVSSN